MSSVAEKFRLELLQYVIDRVNDGCSRNVAFMHAASQARGAARALKLIGRQDWPHFEAIAEEFWDLCFIDARYAKLSS